MSHCHASALAEGWPQEVVCSPPSLIQAMLLAELGDMAQGREIYDRVRPRITELNMLREGLLQRAQSVFETP